MPKKTDKKEDQSTVEDVPKRLAERKARPTIDAGLYSFINVARFHNIPADPEQITHALALGEDGMTEADILRAAKELKLKAKASNVGFDTLAKLPLPVIVGFKKEKFAILAKVDGDKLLVLLPDGSPPKVLRKDIFMRKWTGRIILFTQRFWKDGDRKFDIKWFIPTIIKYKKPLLQVLMAAFMLQILGIFAPILTQVVIDKALSHHSTSTLNVIVFGLVAIALFETFMNITRNYIFTHTTSRIDVILSSRLFRHLFALPLRYFETRRVGDTTARVMELEKVRAFLTGTPMTTLIDVSFMFVYIIVMYIYSPTMTWVVLASLPCFALLAGIITPLLRKRVDEKFNTGAESQAYLVESITGAQTIKSFALEPQLQKNWEGRLSNYVRAGYKMSILSGNAGALASLIQKLLDIAILWFGAHLVMSGKLTIGALIAFRMLSGRVSGPILRLVQSCKIFSRRASPSIALVISLTTRQSRQWIRASHVCRVSMVIFVLKKSVFATHQNQPKLSVICLSVFALVQLSVSWGAVDRAKVLSQN